MTKKYQKNEIDTPAGEGFVVPERVSVAMAEIAGSMREGLLALAVGTGLQVMQVLMEAEVTALAGPKGKHNPQRAAVRHGSEHGSVTLGGRRVPVTHPRVRAADGAGELPVPTYQLFSGTEILGAMAMERMLAGLSTRRYPVGLEPVGDQVSAAASATSKSAVAPDARYSAATHAWCHAHLRRALSAVVDHHTAHPRAGADIPAGWCWAAQLIDALLALTAVTDTGAPPDADTLAGHRRLIVSAALVGAAAGTAPPGAVGCRHRALARRLRRRLDDYLRFATDLRVPFDNNPAERTSAW